MSFFKRVASVLEAIDHRTIPSPEVDLCDKPVDKYIEIETSIILIDVLLLGKEALRHTIFNSHSQFTWKLLILIVLSDGYRKWASSQQRLWGGNYEDYTDHLEWRFYIMCLRAFVEYFTFSALATSMQYSVTWKKGKKCPAFYLVRGIILSSFGKLFSLPVFLWSMNGTWCDMLITCYIILSQVQACKVVTGVSGILAVVIILGSWYISMGTFEGCIIYKF